MTIKPGTALYSRFFASNASSSSGTETEYKKRHDEIWPELSALLKYAQIAKLVGYI